MQDPLIKSSTFENSSNFHLLPQATTKSLIKQACKGRCHEKNLKAEIEREHLGKKRMLRESQQKPKKRNGLGFLLCC